MYLDTFPGGHARWALRLQGCVPRYLGRPWDARRNSHGSHAPLSLPAGGDEAPLWTGWMTVMLQAPWCSRLPIWYPGS